jgi:uncharacterized membrane protein SpoIIM required for sporulation
MPEIFLIVLFIVVWLFGAFIESRNLLWSEIVANGDLVPETEKMFQQQVSRYVSS